ncbi:MAG: cysteine desulfurase [Chlorobi bacterium]|nr:MAG: Cysteine desulfurase SufS [Chlorobi bacterium OLB7]MBK8911680.1 cysteine desulfurase [Chlorobiota bacterium]MBX7216577.1 cysteine desulfurase [Candidatus Kapabacteria bacterium]
MIATDLAPLDVAALRQDFPILQRVVRGKQLVYLDNAATTQKPQQVIEAIGRYYAETNSNVHRGVHYLSEQATLHYEGARRKVAQFLNAESEREIIFTRGTTEAINLVAASFGRKFLREGDEVLLTEMEHHSNIVPWQIACELSGATLRVVPINDDGELMMDQFRQMLSPKTKLVAAVHLSNALGTINPAREIVELAHSVGAYALLDGAQAVSHLPVDVRALDADFYAFSGHKIFGPTGIGVLYGKAALLESMPPYQGGGDMIRSVSFQRTIYNDIPYKFEAGTPHIAGAIGLAAALEYVQEIGLQRIAAWEHELLEYGTSLLQEIPGLRIIGTARQKSSVLSFVLESAHPHDIGTIIDNDGVAIRTGHHCAEPVMHRFGVPATARASVAFYNTREELRALARAIHNVNRLFS